MDLAGAQEEMRFNCHQCGASADRPTGHVNRSRNKGANLYCGRVCMGIARRVEKDEAQKVAEKAAYDTEYRKLNRAMLKAKKREHFQRTYDPVKAAIERKLRMPRHVEYCRRPEYKAWKREYDRQLRAREYGEFNESFLLLQDLERELDARADWYERATQKDTINKTQKRKRSYEQLVRHQS